MNSTGKKNVLIYPLDWGIGHATRVQVIAAELRQRGHKIYIAASHRLHPTFDKSVYDELIILRSATVYYPGHLPLCIAIIFQIPVLFISFLVDRFRLPGIIRKYDIHLVISDNRFGVWNRKTYSIYITHQLRVALPRGFVFVRPLVSAIHRSVANRYDECWVPDLPGDDNLSGMLSHGCKMPANTHYIGPLSRFVILSKAKDLLTTNSFHRSFALLRITKFTLALLSGPEPQRTIFERIIISQKERFPGKLVIVAGTPGKNMQTGDDIIRYPWLDGAELEYLIKMADLIICRSGYSTVMDLYHTGISALLVPTPGQPEQEYLAAYLSEKYNVTVVSQRQLARQADLPAVNMNIKWPAVDDTLPGNVLDQLLRKLPVQARG